MRLFCLATALSLGISSSVSGQVVQTPELSGPAKWTEAKIDRLPPPEALATGQHGVVVIEADVSADNHVANPVVTTSSRSTLLDQAALKIYGHARLGPDLVSEKPSRVRLKIEFGSYDFDNMGVGYLCSQAVLDSDWYAATFPDQPVETNKFKSYLQGAGLFDHRMAFARDKVRFEETWRKVITICRNRPAASVMGLVVLVGNGMALPK